MEKEELPKNFCKDSCPFDHACQRTGKPCRIVEKYLRKFHVKRGWMETPVSDCFTEDWQTNEDDLPLSGFSYPEMTRNTAWEDLNATQQAIVLSVLTGKQKTVFLLKVEGALTQREIAKNLNLNVSTVQHHIEAARKNISKLLDN